MERKMEIRLPDGERIKLDELQYRAAAMHFALAGGDAVEIMRFYSKVSRKQAQEAVQGMVNSVLARNRQTEKLNLER